MSCVLYVFKELQMAVEKDILFFQTLSPELDIIKTILQFIIEK